MVQRQFATSDNAVGFGYEDEGLGLRQYLGEHGCIDALTVDQVGLGSPSRSALFTSIGRLNEVDDGRDVMGGGESEPQVGHDRRI